MRVLVNELVKIGHIRSVRATLLTFLGMFVFVVMLGYGEGVITETEHYGFAAPFLWTVSCGPIGYFMYGAIVAGMAAGEFETGVVHRVLGSGIRRRTYFLAKAAVVFGVSVLIYGISIVFFTLIWSAKQGFCPEGHLIEDYLLKVAVYGAGTCISILAYVALFFFYAYLFRIGLFTIIAAVVTTYADAMGLFYGPVGISMITIRYFRSDTILSWEFAELFRPCIWMIVVCMALSYGLFAVRDVN